MTVITRDYHLLCPQWTSTTELTMQLHWSSFNLRGDHRLRTISLRPFQGNECRSAERLITCQAGSRSQRTTGLEFEPRQREAKPRAPGHCLTLRLPSRSRTVAADKRRRCQQEKPPATTPNRLSAANTEQGCDRPGTPAPPTGPRGFPVLLETTAWNSFTSRNTPPSRTLEHAPCACCRPSWLISR